MWQRPRHGCKPHRFAEPITALGDFAFFRLEITGSRLVSGFGGAINLTARTPPSLLGVSVSR